MAYCRGTHVPFTCRSLGLCRFSDSLRRRVAQALVALAGGSLLCLYGALALRLLRSRVFVAESCADLTRCFALQGGCSCWRTSRQSPCRKRHRASRRPRLYGLQRRASLTLRLRPRNPEALHFRPAFMSLNHRGTRRAS